MCILEVFFHQYSGTCVTWQAMDVCLPVHVIFTFVKELNASFFGKRS